MELFVLLSDYGVGGRETKGGRERKGGRGGVEREGDRENVPVHYMCRAIVLFQLIVFATKFQHVLSERLRLSA